MKKICLILFILLETVICFAESDVSIVAGFSSGSIDADYNGGTKSESVFWLPFSITNYNFLWKNGRLGFFESVSGGVFFDTQAYILTGPAVCFSPNGKFLVEAGAGPLLKYINIYLYHDPDDKSEPTFEDSAETTRLFGGAGIDARIKFSPEKRWSFTAGAKLMAGKCFYDKRSIGVRKKSFSNVDQFFLEKEFFAGVCCTLGK